MSVKQAADALGVHPITIRRLMESGMLPYIEIDGIKRNRYRIAPEDLERLKRRAE